MIAVTTDLVAPPDAVVRWLMAAGGASVLFLSLHKAYTVLRGHPVSEERVLAIEKIQADHGNRIRTLELEQSKIVSADANIEKLTTLLEAVDGRRHGR